MAADSGRRQKHWWWSSVKRWSRQIIGGEELSNTPEGYNGHAPGVSLVKLQTGNSRLESVWSQASRRLLRRHPFERVMSRTSDMMKMINAFPRFMYIYISSLLYNRCDKLLKNWWRFWVSLCLFISSLYFFNLLSMLSYKYECNALMRTIGTK